MKNNRARGLSQPHRNLVNVEHAACPQQNTSPCRPKSHTQLSKGSAAAFGPSSYEQKGPSRPSLSRICLGMCQRLHLQVTAQACNQRAVVCVGTMFFGAATQEDAAHSLLNLAAERGVNCFDTAEMYPVPQSAVHQGQSEIVFGNWLQEHRR